MSYLNKKKEKKKQKRKSDAFPPNSCLWACAVWCKQKFATPGDDAAPKRWTFNNQATISAFWLVNSMSINPKSVQKSVTECKTVKLKMIDSSYFELGQAK